MNDDIVKDWKSENQNRGSEFLSRINATQIILFGLLILFAIWVSKSNNNKYNFVVYGILIAIIAFHYFKPSEKKKLLPEHIIKEIAQAALDKKRREGKEISFDSQVFVTPACHLKWNNDMVSGDYYPVAWEVGFIEKVQGSNYKKEGVITIHPFDGTITGISWRHLGYTGLESRDKDTICVGIIQDNRKASDYGLPKPM